MADFGTPEQMAAFMQQMQQQMQQMQELQQTIAAQQLAAQREPPVPIDRSQRSDRASARARSLHGRTLGRYVATELRLKLGRYVATELWLELGRYVATEWNTRSVAA
ncbi:hypothetical protein F2Q70_00001587 [Brassica cretica]|uniref:Uncharacterized protein n=1 Tax=Brassica cretica TaxID=69181 RepID=A0A8S9ITE9_BRACR|nr:hypothetical protein F2Q70_00001587 [Brassica cretica]